MLYYLFDYIERTFDFPGAGLFQYISFRAGAAAVLSLMITITFGRIADQLSAQKTSW
jgi:phospho-N-acetylmuramoyl-pentapeptide-transferase